MKDDDANRLSEIIQRGIAKLADHHGVRPLPPKFWIELRYLIRDELSGYIPLDN